MQILLKKIKKNWKSGLNVSLVSIPLAVSLAVASNTTPIVGIITAIWAGLVASIFGGSNFNIIGPTGALSGILATYAITYGPNALSMLAILSGIFILIAYFLKLEEYLIFFPSSTIHGFTLGVAFIIALNQINSALGLKNLPIHEKFLTNIFESFKHINQTSLATLLLFCIFIFFLFFLVKIAPNTPGAIILAPIAILLGYLSTKGIIPLDLQTLETRFNNISPKLFQSFDFIISPGLLIPAITIAVISIIETMISARIADGLTKTKHNKRKEMLGLSLANVASGIAGGIPATAALARTALNIKTGGTDKISATISSIFIIIISFLLLSYFKYIPMCAIAAMLVFVAVKMVEKEHFVHMYKIDKKNFYLSLLVAMIIVYEDPIVGILLGGSIAMLYIMKTLSQGHYETISSESLTKDSANIVPEKIHNTLIYSIKGKLAYINSQSHIARFENNPIKQQTIIIDLKDLFFLDLDGADAFSEIVSILKSQNKQILITGAKPFVEKILNSSKEFRDIKNNNLVFENIEKALKSI